MSNKPLITISDEARDWLIPTLKKQNTDAIVVRVNTKGCAGAEYEFSHVREKDDLSLFDKVTDNEITVYFPRIDLFKLVGSELVLNKDGLNVRLDFKNPNEDSRCGCGESVSFQVER